MTTHILDPDPGRPGTLCGLLGYYTCATWRMREHPAAKVDCPDCLILAELATTVDPVLGGR